MKATRPFTTFCRIGVLAAVLALAICPANLIARTILDSSPATRPACVSAVFHREFDASSLAGDERTVLLICATDGAAVSVNGHEIGRINLPKGPIDAASLAPGKNDGIYHRIRIPAELFHAGINAVDADVHAHSAGASPLRCDLEIKTLPAPHEQAEPDEAAKKVLEEFRRDSYIPAGTLIPDGYIDGGHGMRLDKADHATSGREILLVNRKVDPELTKDQAYARSLSDRDPLERAHLLSVYVDKLSTPPAGHGALEGTVDQLEAEFRNKLLCIGDLVDQAHAGVCRHRALLFKILADEAGLKTALVRGKYRHSTGEAGAHAWNEVVLEDGRRYLVDSMLYPTAKFSEITSPAVTPAKVASHYVKLDGTAYYESTRK